MSDPPKTALILRGRLAGTRCLLSAVFCLILVGCGSSGALRQRVDDLTEEAQRVRVENSRLEGRIAEMEAEIESLRSENEELRRSLAETVAQEVLKLESRLDLLKIDLGEQLPAVGLDATSDAEALREKIVKEQEERLKSDIKREIEELEQKVKRVKRSKEKKE